MVFTKILFYSYFMFYIINIANYFMIKKIELTKYYFDDFYFLSVLFKNVLQPNLYILSDCYRV